VGLRRKVVGKVAEAALKAVAKPAGAKGSRKSLVHQRFQNMAYLLAFVWYMICAYMCILYGLSFPEVIQVLGALAGRGLGAGVFVLSLSGGGRGRAVVGTLATGAEAAGAAASGRAGG
jgi:hypothetical protein